MRENEVLVVTKHGRMPTFTVRQDGGGPYPVIILYMDAPGIREELRDMARRIAAQGYYCALPDLYYRLGTVRFDLPRRDDRMSAVVGACLRSIDNDTVNEDTAGLFGYLDGEADAKSDRVSCVGFCMSGRYVVSLSAYFGDRFASAASLYGVGLFTEDDGSPHKLMSQVKGELYFASPRRTRRRRRKRLPRSNRRSRQRAAIMKAKFTATAATATASLPDAPTSLRQRKRPGQRCSSCGNAH
nr:dienelactone hydrolase family protein [Mesorhizobium amorphae]